MARKEAQLISCPANQGYFPGKAVPKACPTVGSRPYINCAERARNGQHRPSCGVGAFRVCTKQGIAPTPVIPKKESPFLLELFLCN